MCESSGLSRSLVHSEILMVKALAGRLSGTAVCPTTTSRCIRGGWLATLPSRNNRQPQHRLHQQFPLQRLRRQLHRGAQR